MSVSNSFRIFINYQQAQCSRLQQLLSITPFDAWIPLIAAISIFTVTNQGNCYQSFLATFIDTHASTVLTNQARQVSCHHSALHLTSGLVVFAMSPHSKVQTSSPDLT